MAQELQDAIVAYVAQEGVPVSSSHVASRFLKLTQGGMMAEKMVRTLLAHEPRLRYSEEGWVYHEISEPLLRDATLYVCRCALNDEGTSICGLSLWELTGGEVHHINTISLRDEKAAFLQILPVLLSRDVILYSYHEKRLLMQLLNSLGYSLTDALWMYETLRGIVGLPAVQKSIPLVEMAQELFTLSTLPQQCKEEGELLADMVLALFQRGASAGCLTMEHFEQGYERELAKSQWHTTEFSAALVQEALPQPGVYGFRDAQGAILYVGKATNLKRRLQSYFLPLLELPAKMVTLRQEAASLVMHPCASELEAHLLELRLKQKYQPRLSNSLRQVSLLAGETISAGVYLLPSSVSDEISLLAMDAESRVHLVRIVKEKCDEVALEQVLKSLFWDKSVAPKPEEGLIAAHWLVRHRDEVEFLAHEECLQAGEMVERVKEWLAS